jgi:hypothetical protein
MRRWLVLVLIGAVLVGVSVAALNPVARAGVKLPERTATTQKAAPPAATKTVTRDALALTPLKAPAPWTPPPLRDLVGAIGDEPEVSRLGLASRARALSPSAPSGSYATVLPNDMGEESADRRLSGKFLHTVLMQGLSRAEQQRRNIALVQAEGMAFLDYVGLFYLHRESPGWYVITLHLSNPTSYSYEITNRLWHSIGQVDMGNALLQETRTMPPHSTLVLPVLVERRASGADFEPYRIYWYASVDGVRFDSRLVVFRALTVDRLS